MGFTVESIFFKVAEWETSSRFPAYGSLCGHTGTEDRDWDMEASNARAETVTWRPSGKRSTNQMFAAPQLKNCMIGLPSGTILPVLRSSLCPATMKGRPEGE